MKRTLLPLNLASSFICTVLLLYGCHTNQGISKHNNQVGAIGDAEERLKTMEEHRRIGESLAYKGSLTADDLKTLLQSAESPVPTVKHSALIVLGEAARTGLYEGDSFEKLLIENLSSTTGTSAVTLLRQFRQYKEIPPSQVKLTPPMSGDLMSLSDHERKWIQEQTASWKGHDQQFIGEFLISKGTLDADSLLWAKNILENLIDSQSEPMSSYWRFVVKGLDSKQP